MDTLYGGLAGQTFIPETIDEFEYISDSITSGAKIEIPMSEENVIPPHQALATLQSEDVDIRPRFWDKPSQQWVLVDTGAQVSVCAPGPNDKIDPRVSLETVDGSKMPSYGSKQATFRLGRKEYHQRLVITNTNETILGMDFIKPNQMEFRWGEFGDYYLYDKKAQSWTLLEFIKMPKSTPSVSKITINPVLMHSGSCSGWQSLQVSALSTDTQAVPGYKIPHQFQLLIDKYPSLKKPNFKEVKHTVEHAIDTKDSPPIRTKTRPLLPGSPKAIAGKKAWLRNGYH